MKNVIIFLNFIFISITCLSQNVVETKYFEKNKDVGGDVLIIKSSKGIAGNKTLSTFEVEVPEAGIYHIFFWLCPSQKITGEYTEYEVFQGETPIGKLKPTKGDWQSVTVDGGKGCYLNKGTTTISVKGLLPEVPNVEFVRMSKDREKAIISDDKYADFKSEIRKISHSQIGDYIRDSQVEFDTLAVDNARKGINFPLPPQDNPPYDASFVIDVLIRYTFYTTMYFQQGDTVNLSSVGTNNFPHIIELFSSTSPASYSWTSAVGANTALSVSIPIAGYYYVKVRSWANASTGLCNLNINNAIFYNEVPVYSLGIRGEKDTTSVYNSFTCNNTGDPRIWVEEGGTSGKITAFSDDYISTSTDYYWGFNSRVKKQYTRMSNAVLFSAFSSYNPICTCDVYCNCLSAYETEGENFLQSAPATQGGVDYNCASWAGGIYTSYIWPPNVFVNESNSELEAFDQYFGANRYPGCAIYTREGATFDNSVIHLWGNYDADGTLYYTHTSVKKGSDGNAHGFAYESKLGSLIRVYHPLGHLPLNYGYVLGRYRKVDTEVTSISLEEAIANGSAVFENVHFTEAEKGYIEKQINRISPIALTKFNELYNKWEHIWDTSYLSDPDMIANCPEYDNLLSYCKKTGLLKFAVFKLLDAGKVNTICLVKDLTLDSNKLLLEKVFSENRKRIVNDKGARIIRTMQSNAMLYVKKLLKKENRHFEVRDNPESTTDIEYSNSNEFKIRQGSESVVLSFDISRSVKIYADIVDLSGKIVGVFVQDRQLAAGTYVYECYAPEGVYLARYIVNGNINVKKFHME